MNKSELLHKIKGKSKCDMIVEEVISLIANKVYKSGDKLPTEGEFAEQFGASRVTVRESFKMLRMMGIISIRQGEGTFVNSLDIGTVMRPLLSLVIFDQLSVNQLYEARKVVEMGTVSLAAKNRTPDDIKFLREINVRTEVAVNTLNFDSFTEFDTQFHLKICEIAGNFVLQATYSMIKDLLKYFIAESSRVDSAMATSLMHHKFIVDFIEAGREKDAELMMKKHIEIVQRSLLDRMKNQKGGS
jgi:GntR family transcriptional repressor for pyruvate dehydrogenase complex